MPATCPFNVPVVSLPPQSVNGFSWGSVIRPLGDACVGSIAVEPTDDSAWYVGGVSGLYVTKNGGAAWTHPLAGSVGAILLVPAAPGSEQLVYAGIDDALHLSRDRGKN